MKLKDIVTKNVLQVMKDKNITTKELAEMAGMKELHLVKMLNIDNPHRRITLGDLDKIAIALEVNIAELWYEF